MFISLCIWNYYFDYIFAPLASNTNKQKDKWWGLKIDWNGKWLRLVKRKTDVWKTRGGARQQRFNALSTYSFSRGRTFCIANCEIEERERKMHCEATLSVVRSICGKCRKPWLLKIYISIEKWRANYLKYREKWARYDFTVVLLRISNALRRKKICCSNFDDTFINVVVFNIIVLI